jgi:peptidyl-tRNA hydrolase
MRFLTSRSPKCLIRYIDSILYHYVIVRRDLPLGVIVSQTIHAAGESAGNKITQNTHAIALAVPSEQELLALESKLREAKIPHRAIREPDPPFNGQITAIGLVPAPREALKKYLSQYPLLK